MNVQFVHRHGQSRQWVQRVRRCEGAALTEGTAVSDSYEGVKCMDNWCRHTNTAGSGCDAFENAKEQH